MKNYVYMCVCMYITMYYFHVYIYLCDMCVYTHMMDVVYI